MNENKIYKIKIEADCINYLKNILTNKFDFVRLFDGCKADIAIKPKNIPADVDEWIGIQIKSTQRKVKNNNSEAYKFDLSKDSFYSFFRKHNLIIWFRISYKSILIVVLNYTIMFVNVSFISISNYSD